MNVKLLGIHPIVIIKKIKNKNKNKILCCQLALKEKLYSFWLVFHPHVR